jgi:hypothetical protein
MFDIVFIDYHLLVMSLFLEILGSDKNGKIGSF